MRYEKMFEREKRKEVLLKKKEQDDHA